MREKEPEIPKAPEKTEEKDSGKDQEQTGDTTEEKTPEEENPQTTPEQMSELFKKLTNGVLRGEQAIDVREFHIPQTKADSIYQQFLAKNPFIVPPEDEWKYRIPDRHRQSGKTWRPSSPDMP